MKKIIYIIVMVNLLLFTGCQNDIDDNNMVVSIIDINTYNETGEVKIDRTLFKDSDIESYDINNHIIYFTTDFISSKKVNIEDFDLRLTELNSDTSSILQEESGSFLLGVSAAEKFAVIIDDEVIYTGDFKQTSYSSYFPPSAVIYDFNQGIIIGHNGFEDDKRNDDRIIELLKAKDLVN